MTRGEERKRDGEKPTKYFGKWPLKHVYGIQVTSSLLSLIYIYICLLHLMRLYKSRSYVYVWFLVSWFKIVLFCVALLDVRLWSTIFKFLNLTKRSVFIDLLRWQEKSGKLSDKHKTPYKTRVRLKKITCCWSKQMFCLLAYVILFRPVSCRPVALYFALSVLYMNNTRACQRYHQTSFVICLINIITLGSKKKKENKP